MISDLWEHPFPISFMVEPPDEPWLTMPRFVHINANLYEKIEKMAKVHRQHPDTVVNSLLLANYERLNQRFVNMYLQRLYERNGLELAIKSRDKVTMVVEIDSGILKKAQEITKDFPGFTEDAFMLLIQNSYLMGDTLGVIYDRIFTSLKEKELDEITSVKPVTELKKERDSE